MHQEGHKDLTDKYREDIDEVLRINDIDYDPYVGPICISISRKNT